MIRGSITFIIWIMGKYVAMKFVIFFVLFIHLLQKTDSLLHIHITNIHNMLCAYLEWCADKYTDMWNMVILKDCICTSSHDQAVLCSCQFADQIAHSVGLLVSAEFVHLHFRFSRLVRYDKDNYFARLASVGSVVSRCRSSEAYRRTALRTPNATSKFALSAATGNPCKSVFRAVRIPIFG